MLCLGSGSPVTVTPNTQSSYKAQLSPRAGVTGARLLKSQCRRYLTTTTTAPMLLRCAGSGVRNARASRRLYSSLGKDSSRHEECDVVIVGGGPAGLAFASALGAPH